MNFLNPCGVAHYLHRQVEPYISWTTTSIHREISRVSLVALSAIHGVASSFRRCFEIGVRVFARLCGYVTPETRIDQKPHVKTFNHSKAQIEAARAVMNDGALAVDAAIKFFGPLANPILAGMAFGEAVSIAPGALRAQAGIEAIQNTLDSRPVEI
jgi:hypothetical protein